MHGLSGRPLFYWLALHGRLWTAERRQRHGLQQHGACALCDQADETTDHLLCSCVFTCEIWTRLLAPAGIDHLAPQPTSLFADWWLLARETVPADGRRAFDSLVLATSWIIWKERNRRTFDNIARMTTQVLDAITEELDSYVAAGFRCLATFLHFLG